MECNNRVVAAMTWSLHSRTNRLLRFVVDLFYLRPASFVTNPCVRERRRLSLCSRTRLPLACDYGYA